MWNRVFRWGLPAGLGAAMMALPDTGWLGAETAKLVFWAGLSITAICLLGLSWSVFNIRDFSPLRRFVTLKQAAEHAYGQLHGIMIGHAADELTDGRDPLGWIATHMLLTGHLPLAAHFSTPPSPHSPNGHFLRFNLPPVAVR